MKTELLLNLIKEDKDLLNEYVHIERILQENNAAKIKEYLRDKIISPILSFYTEAANNIYNLTRSSFNKIINGIKLVFKLLGKFKEKYPRLTKALILLILIIIVMLIVGTVSAYASSGGDLSILQKAAQDGNTSIGELEAMYGMLDVMKTELGNSAGHGVVIETKGLIMDLLDGKVDIQTFSQQSKKLGDDIFNFFNETYNKAQMGDSSSIEILTKALSRGRDLITNTTIKLGKISINPDGTINESINLL